MMDKIFDYDGLFDETGAQATIFTEGCGGADYDHAGTAVAFGRLLRKSGQACAPQAASYFPEGYTRAAADDPDALDPAVLLYEDRTCEEGRLAVGSCGAVLGTVFAFLLAGVLLF